MAIKKRTDDPRWTDYRTNKGAWIMYGSIKEVDWASGFDIITQSNRRSFLGFTELGFDLIL